MKKITLFLMAIMVSTISWSQCIVGTAFGTETTPNDGTVTGISTCSYAGEYNTISNIISGNDYVFTNTLAGVDNYVTITDAADEVIAHGMSPLTVTALTAETVRLHVTIDAACTTDSACHVSTVQNLTVAANACPDPSGLTVSNITDMSADLDWTDNGIVTVDFNIEVYLAGESAAGSNVAVFSNANVTGTSISVTGLSEATDYDAYIVAACSGTTTNSTLLGPVSFTTTASCSDVTAVMIDNISAVGGDISWTIGTGNDAALVEVYAAGESAANGDTAVYSNAAATGGADTASGLMSNIGYDVFVTGICGVTATTAVGPESFTTACAPITPDYTADMSMNVPDACWDEATAGDLSTGPTSIGSSDWRQGTSYALGNSNAINLYFNNDSEWLLSPTFDLSTGGPFQLEVNVAVTDWQSATADATMGSDDEVQLLMTTDDGVTWTNITTWNAANEPTPGGVEYIEDLTAITGNVMFAIWATDGTADDTEDYDFHVGKFVVRVPPSCLEPSGLSAGATGLDTADISWTAGDSETEWTYEYGVSPYTQGGGGTTGTVMTTPSLSLTGLTSGETYDIFVQANCGVGNASAYITTTWTQPLAGATCDVAIDVPSLPYNTTDDTANYGDNYTGIPGTTCGATSAYLNGDDVVYSYTATADTQISIDLTPTATYSGIFVYADCADIGTACIAGIGNSSTDIREIDLDVLTGETYYIVISTWATPQSTAYTLDIYENTCVPATVAYNIVSDCDVSGGFLVDVEISDMGTATDILVSNDQDAITFTVSSASTVQFGPYVNGTDVIFTLDDQGDDDTCTVISSAITQTVCPPANDDCSGATALTPGGVFADNAIDGTVLGATADAEAASCGTNGAGVWYSIVVPASGDVTIQVGDDSSGGTGFDSVIEAFTGTCGSFNSIGCDDDGVPGFGDGYSQLELTGLTGGETIYVRVWEYGGNEVEPFSISAYSASLSVGNVENEAAFTYYPNPVKNTLTLNAQNTIEQVAMYNMLGQEVLRVTPNTVDSDINMSSLQTGAYFVKVTIGNVTETIRVIKQ
jgi:Secretion system C-terminal sorting domain